jgi:ribosome maturation factor RimP
MEVMETVRALCEPIAEELGIEIYDVERAGGIVRISVDQPDGIPMDLVTEASRRISRMLDEHDPIPGSYTLEVTSPGLERNLRTPDHFRWAVGQLVSIRTRYAGEEPRRFRATVVEADDDGVTLEPEDGSGVRRYTYAEIDRARSIFEWGPTPRPGGASKGTRPAGGSASDSTTSDDTR